MRDLLKTAIQNKSATMHQFAQKYIMSEEHVKEYVEHAEGIEECRHCWPCVTTCEPLWLGKQPACEANAALNNTKYRQFWATMETMTFRLIQEKSVLAQLIRRPRRMTNSWRCWPAKTWYCDGTLTQLFGVHAFIWQDRDYRQVPLVFVLIYRTRPAFCHVRHGCGTSCLSLFKRPVALVWSRTCARPTCSHRQQKIQSTRRRGLRHENILATRNRMNCTKPILGCLSHAISDQLQKEADTPYKNNNNLCPSLCQKSVN
ncbi:hypothetical protein Bbelb_036640 [Branchiostoma belcheri]|nr:hypothetical protein Bbelb_036640 [Branchiostoma belcheri]